MTIDPRFIVDLHGKQYITHEGLLHMAHEAGLTSISTSLISYGGVGKEAVVRATVEGEKGKRLMFTGLGDASPENVGRGIATATLRMAETRAVNRALRAYLGIGMTTYEEMPEGEPAVKHQAQPAPRAQAPRAPSSAAPGDSALEARVEAVRHLPTPPCTKCGGPTRQTKRWDNPNGSRAPWYSCRDYDYKTKEGCGGGIWDLPVAPDPGAEHAHELDMADRHADEEIPF